MSTHSVWLTVELLALFVALPLLLYWRVLPRWPVPTLIGSAIVIFFVLRSDPAFDQRRLWNVPAAIASWQPVLLRMTVLGGAFVCVVFLWARPLLSSFVRAAPRLWLAVVVLYPLLSVYPQEIIYRSFFFHRYQALFGHHWILILASAVAFAFVHIIFGHWISVFLAFLGGLLFGFTYSQSGSLLLASVEHAFWGNLMFTIGLGHYFYHGRGLRSPREGVPRYS